MLKLEYEDYFDHPIERVFETFRDKMEKYTKYLPNPKYCKVKERKQLDEYRVKTKAEWMGFGEIPFIVRAFLRPEMIKWKDEAIWDEKNYEWTWTIEPFYFKEFVECKGRWYLKKHKGGTKIISDGYLKIYIPRFPGIPDKIAQGAGTIIEKFIGRYQKPNLTATIKAVRKFLEEEE